MDRSKSIGYRIVSCRERSFDVKVSTVSKVSESDVSFKFGCSFNSMPSGCLSIVIVSELMLMEETAIKVESETIFEIKPFDVAFDTSSTKKIVDRIGIMPTLFSLAYGSTRGMMAIRTSGTVLANFPLPIVDAVDVTQRMMQQS